MEEKAAHPNDPANQERILGAGFPGTQTSQFNPVFNQQIVKIQTALTPQVGSTAAHNQAYGLIYQMLQQQASLWSYGCALEGAYVFCTF